MYPVMLSVKGRRCLVVGGGGVALRKVEGLLAEGATVVVVAQDPIPPLLALSQAGSLELHTRPYEPGEATRFALVFAATDQREVNRRVFEDASSAGIWVNVADDPDLCSFHLPARVQRGPLVLAVASAGEAPFLVRRLRQLLERRLGHEWAAWAEAAGRFRRLVRGLGLPRAAQERSFDDFFAGTIDAAHLRARVPSAAEEKAWTTAAGPKASGEIHPDPPPEAAVQAGFVSLVGAGPGDPGLLTLRGRARLLAADAVVYDRLAATAIPCDLHAAVELHPVGKEAQRHSVPQEEINALLVRLAKQGKRVVRLKGGDPFVFGRGGEEIEALKRASITFEVVPCVTAGVAVPAYAGIPATHRDDASQLTLVTAHESARASGPNVRWDLLAQDPHATIVGYMGVANLPQVVARLVAAGMDPRTPAAMVERGTTSGQRMVTATLTQLPQEATRANIEPPALFILGSAVRHAAELAWYTARPLFGERLAAVSPDPVLVDALGLAGAELLEVSLPLTPAAKIVLAALPLTGWLFFSPDEVEAIDDERDTPGFGPDVKAWCLHPDAASRAITLGWRNVVELAPDTEPKQLLAAMAARRLGPPASERTGSTPS